MNTQLDTKVVKFNVAPEHCRTFPDPNNLGRKRYFAQVAVDEIHRARIDYGPNPRNQNMETKVAEAIRESLKTEGGWFLYYNKGIVINAEAVEYDNKTGTLRVELKRNNTDPWESPNGNMDGGHTNKVILDLIDGGKWENPSDPKLKQYVTLEILTGIDPQKLSNLVGARNTNTPVKDLSLAVLGKELDWLLEIFAKAGVKDKIAWRQFDYDASITGEEVLAYLSLLNPQLKEKSRCYTGAGRLVSDLKLRGEHNGVNPLMEGLKTTAPIAVAFLTFVDYIHTRVESWYVQLKDEAGENSSFGNLAGISISKDGHDLVFSREVIRYKVTKAWLMPLAHAFTGVVARENNADDWRIVADAVGPQLMENLVNMTKNEKYNLNGLAKNKSAWDTLTALVEAAYWKQKAFTGTTDVPGMRRVGPVLRQEFDAGAGIGPTDRQAARNPKPSGYRSYQINCDDIDFDELVEDALAKLKAGDQIMFPNLLARDKVKLQKLAEEHSVDFRTDFNAGVAYFLKKAPKSVN